MQKLTEETLLETLKNWSFYKNRITSLNKKLNEKTFKVTASISADVKVMSGWSATSKIESFCFSRMKIKDERDEIIYKMKLCIMAYEKTDLSNLERQLIRATMRKESLLVIANIYGIPQARIYRMRDRAAKKMYSFIQNEVYN